MKKKYDNDLIDLTNSLNKDIQDLQENLITREQAKAISRLSCTAIKLHLYILERESLLKKPNSIEISE